MLLFLIKMQISYLIAFLNWKSRFSGHMFMWLVIHFWPPREVHWTFTTVNSVIYSLEKSLWHICKIFVLSVEHCTWSLCGFCPNSVYKRLSGLSHTLPLVGSVHSCLHSHSTWRAPNVHTSSKLSVCSRQLSVAESAREYNPSRMGQIPLTAQLHYLYYPLPLPLAF